MARGKAIVNLLKLSPGEAITSLVPVKEFDEAHNLLQTCNEDLAESSHILRLRGETLFQAERFEEAKSLFRDYLESSAWDEHIALSLARTHEALGEKEKARDLYGELMQGCTTCARQIDPFIKRRYSDLSLECGQCSTRVLDLYLSLVHEDPDNKDAPIKIKTNAKNNPINHLSPVALKTKATPNTATKPNI